MKKWGRGKEKTISCVLLMPLVLSVRLHAAINAKDEHDSTGVRNVYYKFHEI
jgi:hypothetical protein